jgi:purine-binding chemotaxis protein CheW
MSELRNTLPGANVNLGEMSGPFVTFEVGKQLFGVPVAQVQDILTLNAIAAVPLGPPEVRGMINLRGRIVTVVDVRKRLGMAQEADPSCRAMGVTVENGAESYTLLVDRVGDVISLPAHLREANPVTLDPLWREFVDGVFRVAERLLVVLDVTRLLNIRAKP